MLKKDKDNKELWHNLHVRIDPVLWRRFRRTFPDYGALKTVINRALEDFLDKWEDINAYLDKCEILREQLDREKRFAREPKVDKA